jgi:hypothetical protein
VAPKLVERAGKDQNLGHRRADIVL